MIEMADRITKEQRSRNMAAVRSYGNVTTELELIKIFRKGKIRGWRRNKKTSGIRPDFVFLKHRVAVFVHGCFWHGCKKCTNLKPKTNKKFWVNKIGTNIERDKKHNKELKKTGWKVVCIWEHEIKNNPESVVRNIKKALV